MLLFQGVNLRFNLFSLPNIRYIFRLVRWLFAKSCFGCFALCFYLAHERGSLNTLLHQRLVFRRRSEVFELLNSKFLLLGSKLLGSRVCAFWLDLGFFFQFFLLLNQCVVPGLQISQVLGLSAFCSLQLFCFFGTLSFDLGCCFGLKAGGFSCLGFSTSALKRTSNRCKCAAKHSAADEALDILLAGFWVSDTQASLQALQHLLRGFSYTFSACSYACLGGVIHDGSAKRLISNSPGLLGCQLGAHRTKQFANTGNQRHCSGVKQSLRYGCGGCFAKAGLLKSFAGIDLSAEVGSCKLSCRHSTCAQQTKASSNRGGYWSS